MAFSPEKDSHIIEYPSSFFDKRMLWKKRIASVRSRVFEFVSEKFSLGYVEDERIAKYT